MVARSKSSNQRPDTLMQDRKPTARRKPLATRGRTIHSGQTRKSARLNGMSVLHQTADVVGPPRHVRVVPLIGIGGSLAAPALPHHRAYGSVHGGSRSCATTIGTRMAGRVILSTHFRAQ